MACNDLLHPHSGYGELHEIEHEAFAVGLDKPYDGQLERVQLVCDWISDDMEIPYVVVEFMEFIDDVDDNVLGRYYGGADTIALVPEGEWLAVAHEMTHHVTWEFESGHGVQFQIYFRLLIAAVAEAMENVEG